MSTSSRPLQDVLKEIATAAEGPELAILRLLGLFDRPAQPRALAALRAEPAIPGLTEPLMDLGEEEWQSALSELREHGLLLPAAPHQPGTLDAPPLVRVFFQEKLEKQRPEAWQAGNLRLYEHFQKEAPDMPDTLEDLEPLFTAVIHGCRAGQQQEVFREVYRRRISHFSEPFDKQRLGVFGSILSALSCFFDRLWDQPSANLTSGDHALLLDEAAFYLILLGRLAEAAQPLEASLKARLKLEDWNQAAIRALNLSQLTLTLGMVERAVACGKQSVDLADRSSVTFWRMASRAALADALHQSGRWEESTEAFREAEVLQSEREPQYPRLSSLQGYQYCDLLLSRGSVVEVRERARQMLSWSTGDLDDVDLLDIALGHLSLGRAHLGHGEESEAEHLDHAMEGLRRAGVEDHIPRGLLARAAFRRLRGDLPAAEADLSEALEIAERGSLRLHECDAHLEWARLCRQRGDRDGLERHVARARTLVEETGYGRRRGEVEELERQVSV